MSVDKVKEVLQNIPFYGGTTYANEGLMKAIDQLSSSPPEAKKIMIVFTDGYSQEDTQLGRFTTVSATQRACLTVSVQLMKFFDEEAFRY